MRGLHSNGIRLYESIDNKNYNISWPNIVGHRLNEKIFFLGKYALEDDGRVNYEIAIIRKYTLSAIRL